MKNKNTSCCDSDLAKRPIFYTDTVSDKQALRDDLWAVTTAELDAVESELKKLRALVRDYEQPERDRRTAEDRHRVHDCARMEDEYDKWEKQQALKKKP